ncbi:potassium channel family protein [Rhabdothermincola salaria]|uniref:potassium channel family protein n=1 Tax=Rhabdothermincola salaria TaxID=2903142 RepID=UPI001E29FCB6|nr:potassium channel family protein [Rhabdothermincola salaria]MCD9622920.1 potassium channel family protein [Rhabdothermincola salaria]
MSSPPQPDTDASGPDRAGPKRWWRRRAAARAAARETPAYAAYVARTEAYLDLFALVTIWLTVVPMTPSLRPDQGWGWDVGRMALSVVFGVDLLVRSRLSGQGWRYVSQHPALSLAVIVPPVRILFSLRLLRSMFARGNLAQFLVVAALLVLNGAVIVFAFESGAEGSNIETMGEALWWTAVTVATVGYGDFTPVTVGGRLTATLLMVLAIVVAAVVTAQIASNFNDQAAQSRGDERGPADDGTDVPTGRATPLPAMSAAQHAELMARLERIEGLLLDGRGDETGRDTR